MWSGLSSHQPFPFTRPGSPPMLPKKYLNVPSVCIHLGLHSGGCLLSHPLFRVVTAALAFCKFSVTILPTTCTTILTLFSLKRIAYFCRFLGDTMFTTIGFVYYCLFTFACLFLVLGWNPGPYAKCSAARMYYQPVFCVLRLGLTTWPGLA